MTYKYSFYSNINKYIIFFFIILSIWYLSYFLHHVKNYTEGLTDMGNPSTSHTVNLPINTIYSCSNMCGSQSKCYITGGNCLSDIDCPGCNTYKQIKQPHKTREVPGDSDAGKYSYLTPQYSSLTSGFFTPSDN